jgi:hypothetical protein
MPGAKHGVHLLTGSGYNVDLRDDYISAERLDHEGGFDFIIPCSNRPQKKALIREHRPPLVEAQTYELTRT